MAASNTFEVPAAFWDDFLDPSFDFANFVNGTELPKSNGDSKPAPSTDPDRSYPDASADAQGLRLDELPADDSPTMFEAVPDLPDDFWNHFPTDGPSLADFDKFLQESSNSLGPSDLGCPVSIPDSSSYTHVPASFGGYQSPEFPRTPALPEPSKLPVVPSFEVPQPADQQSQGPAPTAIMYLPPATNQVVRAEPEAVAVPAPTGLKRKAVTFDDSVNLDTLPAKRQKVEAPHTASNAVSPRTDIIHTFDASKVYDPKPYHPKDWSIFKYTRDGELDLGTLYTPRQILYYLYRHPLQTLSDGSQALKKGRLRLWIQRNPSDSKRRYPTSLRSNRCRFKDCFATHSVISGGHLRLCFDEFAHLNNEYLHTDPFHNAGYVHLNCLERFLDFPQLCHDLPVMLDDRDMPLEPECRNNMSLAPRHMAGRNLWDVASKGARPHPGTFVWRVMLAKVGGFPSRFGVSRESQQGVHLGDLELEYAERNEEQARTEDGAY
ncbi:MAG: hypothetical protein Q9168_000099 [Polycauliona sp. 1 TL-2023]